MKITNSTKHTYPEISDSADDERNLSKLKEESMKMRPSHEILKTLQIRTYPVRRATIMDSTSTITCILTDMQMLKKCQYVI